MGIHGPKKKKRIQQTPVRNQLQTKKNITENNIHVGYIAQCVFRLDMCTSAPGVWFGSMHTRIQALVIVILIYIIQLKIKNSFYYFLKSLFPASWMGMEIIEGDRPDSR